MYTYDRQRQNAGATIGQGRDDMYEALKGTWAKSDLRAALETVPLPAVGEAPHFRRG
jgi:hypothetical protein